jgi:hypothetical protein
LADVVNAIGVVAFNSKENECGPRSVFANFECRMKENRKISVAVWEVAAIR